MSILRGMRFAGSGPGGRGLLFEPALFTAGLGTIGLLDAIDREPGGGTQELGVNALLTAAPALAAAGGAGVLSARSPRAAHYLGERLGRPIQSKARQQEAEDSIALGARMQQVLNPGLSSEAARDLVVAETRERLLSVLNNAALAGAVAGGLGMMTQGERGGGYG